MADRERSGGPKKISDVGLSLLSRTRLSSVWNEYGWAAYENVSLELLELPFVARKVPYQRSF
jgi:hypothetical protein